MIKFALLASGSKGNCCIIKDENSSIIIDCGSTKKYLTQSFQKLQYDYKKSDALFVTHTHSDHISQLKMFEDIPTYARCTLNTENFNTLLPFSKTQINSLTIQEIPLSHDSDICSGYVISNATHKLVYITDTGYVKEEYFEYLKNADYYIFESNHDIELLMKTRRPMYVKQRIVGDEGHLCNEDSAEIISKLIGEKTKEIILAHISEEGNTREKALMVLENALSKIELNTDHIRKVAAPQFQIVIGGGKAKEDHGSSTSFGVK